MKKIRMATPSDATSMLAIYNPFIESSPVTFETTPITEAEYRGHITKSLGLYPWLVYEVDDRVVGFAYSSQHRVRKAYQWSIDVSAYIAPTHRRQGIGKSLYLALFEILKKQNFYRVFAGITLPNPASVGLHESLGFRPVGVYHDVGFKLGAWRDVGWWQLELQMLPTVPNEPIPLQKLKIL